ncbi:MAG: hypothetical protein IKW86_06555 [Salinivirgaceae bacterium]|nr:hypothetical protein [Salinivirgaceae bacterium]
MKRLLIPILLMLIVVNVKAQTDGKRHEVALSYGIVSMPEMFESNYIELEASKFLRMNVNIHDVKHSEVIGLQYAYQPVRWFELGVVGCFNRTTANAYPYYTDSTEEKAIGDASFNYLTIMPIIKLNWFDTKFFGMYSKFAYGLSVEKIVVNNWNDNTTSGREQYGPGYQVSPICLQVGTPEFRIFLEGGLGFQGIINMGLKYKF